MAERIEMTDRESLTIPYGQTSLLEASRWEERLFEALGIEMTEREPLTIPYGQNSLLEASRREGPFFEALGLHFKRFRDIDIDFVYPGLSGKTLLEDSCCEGRVESVKALLHYGADVNRLNDSYKLAPIHFAAKAGHADVLKVLLNDKRCKPNLEIEQQTALHIAVDKNFTECVSVLLEYDAHPNIANSEGLRPIDIAVRKAHREIVQLILKNSKFLPNLDFQDRDNITTRQILQNEFLDLELPTAGESIMKINDSNFWMRFCENESVILEELRKVVNYQLTDVGRLIECATRYNFANVIRELLKKGRRDDCFLSIRSASTYALDVGYHRVLREMVTFDVDLGNELLLLACELGAIEPLVEDQIECVKLILDQPNLNVHREDSAGNTPLYYAVRAGSNEAISRLLELGSYLGHRNRLGEPPLAHISPSALKGLFDNCISATIELDYQIIFDYRYFIHYIPPSCRQANGAPEEFGTSDETTPVTIGSEMDVLAYIAENRTLQPLLNHPLLLSFLNLKWRRIRHVLCANFFFYLIFYILINAYILSIDHKIDSPSSSTSNSSNLTLNLTSNLTSNLTLNLTSNLTSNLTKSPHTSSQQLNTLGTFTTMFLILLTMRETYQLISSPGHYLSSLDNLLEIILIVLGFLTVVAPNPQISAAVILLSAWELVILIGQYPGASIGIEMLKIVTKTFIKFLIHYAILIIAFAFAFFMLFGDTKIEDKKTFLDRGGSLFKTIIMLTGEFEANSIPFEEHLVFSRCIFVLFVLLIVIVMLNLLNGLAVSETAHIKKTSEIVALISRVKLISYFEGVAVGLGPFKLVAERWNLDRALRRTTFNAPRFFGMITHLVPKDLSVAKIGVLPDESGQIVVYESSEEYVPTDWSMDPSIVRQAEENFWHRISEAKAAMENQRIIAVFNKINAKLDKQRRLIRVAVEILENPYNVRERRRMKERRRRGNHAPSLPRGSGEHSV